MQRARSTLRSAGTEDVMDEKTAVPGPESHESDETLSPDEKGTEQEPVPPPAPPSGPPRPRKLRWPFRRSP
jgi:hypothetical protein